MYKLKRIDIEKLEKKKKQETDDHPVFEEFLEQLDTDKEMRSQVNLYKDQAVVEEKIKNKMLKKTEKSSQKKEIQDKKLKIKRQFEDLKQETKNQQAEQEENWEDEDGIKLNELINDLKLEDVDEVPELVDQKQVESFLNELDKIKINN